MKHTLRSFFLLYSILWFSSYSQAQGNMFMAYNSNTWYLAQETSYGYVLFGSTSNGISVLAKADSTGKIISERTYPSCVFGDVKYMQGKGLLVAGNFSRQGSDSAFLMRLDNNGNVLWSNIYAFPTYKGLSNISVSISQYSGSLWLKGMGADKSSSNFSPGFIVKTDTTGTVISSKEIVVDSTSGVSLNTPGPVVEGTDKSCYFTVNTGAFEASGFTLFKIDSMFNMKWYKILEYSGPNYNGMLSIGNSIYMLWRRAYDNAVPDSGAIINLSQLDTSGVIKKSLVLQEWNTFYGGYGNCLYHTTDGGFVFAGMTPRNSGFIQAGLVVKVDSLLGSIQWSREYGVLNSSANPNQYLNYVSQTRDGGFIVAGKNIIKTDPWGTVDCHDTVISYQTQGINTFPFSNGVNFNNVSTTTSTVSVTPTLVSDTLSFYCYDLITGEPQITNTELLPRAFPNPNNGSFNIELPAQYKNTHIEIYNTIGEKIYDKALTPGINNLIVTDQSTGLYLYRIIDLQGKLVNTGKLVIR